MGLQAHSVVLRFTPILFAALGSRFVKLDLLRSLEAQKDGARTYISLAELERYVASCGSTGTAGSG
jgi:hypothetical protein